MNNEQRDQHLQALVRYMQQDAKLAMDMWRDFGNAMMLYTDNQKVLMASLSQIFDHLGGDAQPITAAEPTPLPAMPYPAYGDPRAAQQPPSQQQAYYPASSQQPPWPPQQPVPTATVQHRQTPPPQPQQREWTLSDVLRSATPRN